MALFTPSKHISITFQPGYIRAKRVLDISFSLLIFIPLTIIIIIFAILIRIDSKGPVFFRQKRIGKDGVPFDMLKLRSMYIDSDDSLHRESIKQYMNGGAINGNAHSNDVYKLVDDPRITRVGHFIRKFSIDELPQFVNVLRGEMSLVGPRPPLPYEVEEYGPRDWIRLS
ncbi:MAG: sugar transferase, partial [Ktedonobacteraceae bacterium]